MVPISRVKQLMHQSLNVETLVFAFDERFQYALVLDDGLQRRRIVGDKFDNSGLAIVTELPGVRLDSRHFAQLSWMRHQQRAL